MKVQILQIPVKAAVERLGQEISGVVGGNQNYPAPAERPLGPIKPPSILGN